MTFSAPGIPSTGTLRLAGALYLAIIVLGIGSEAALRAPLIDLGNAAASAAAIRDAAGTFRLSAAADLVMALCDVALAVLLFMLFRPVAPILALTAMVFRLVQAAIISANLIHLQAALLLIAGGPDLATLAPDEASALATLFLALHGHGYDLGLAFFGINSVLTGVLIWMSGLVPRAIGAGLIAAGAVYLTGSGLRLLAPAMVDAFMPAYGVAVIAETAFCLWLLVLGRIGPDKAG